jgi:CheY-like chemotaxis protein
MASAEQYEGKTILIVEDDNISRALYREVFKNRGINIYFMKTGGEALDFFENNPVPDLVLMDIRLPDINGLDVSKQILAKHPEVKIVAQTAFAHQNMEEACFAIGMVGFLTKPIGNYSIQKILDMLV